MRSIIVVVSCSLLLSACGSYRAPSPVKTVYTDKSGKTYTRGNKSPYVVLGKSYEVMPDSLGYLEIGIASWYGKKFHGRQTSNGEIYDVYKLTAAHKSLPLPTMVKVTNLDNSRSVVVRVNDRGPFHDYRLIDLSWATARKLGFAGKGTVPVVVEALDEVNYPNRVREPFDRNVFYLQVGAFSQLSGAEQRRRQIEALMNDHDVPTIDVNILQSELQTDILHKVWLGPIVDEERREQIVRMVQRANLGSPLRVELD